jgi:hypothetical protein
MTDIEKAIYYAKRRIDKTELMTTAIKSKYLNVFKRICTLTYNQGVAPSYFTFEKYIQLQNKVDGEINKLMRDLYQIIEQYSIACSSLAMNKNDREDELDVIGYINRPIDGRDINARLAEYGEKAKYEFEAMIAAGLLLSKPINAVFNDYKAFLLQPYSSALIKEVRAQKGVKIAAKRLLTRNVSFGAGKYISTTSSLYRLGEGTLNYVYHWADEIYMQRNGAIGYNVYRGSSYPCQACDDVVGFHPIGSYVLPVHPRCVCYKVPIYM